MTIRRRIEELEKKAGVNEKITIVILKNYAKANRGCKAHKEGYDLCPHFEDVKKRTTPANGIKVVTPPCDSCKGGKLWGS